MRRQQELVHQGDTPRIEVNVREQEAALRRSRYFDCRRRQLVSALMKDCTFIVGTPNLAQIIATVSNDYGSRLASLRDSMQRPIERLHETRENNRTLIEQSLGNLNEFIRSTQTGGPTRFLLDRRKENHMSTLLIVLLLVLLLGGGGWGYSRWRR